MQERKDVVKMRQSKANKKAESAMEEMKNLLVANPEEMKTKIKGMTKEELEKTLLASVGITKKSLKETKGERAKSRSLAKKVEKMEEEKKRTSFVPTEYLDASKYIVHHNTKDRIIADYLPIRALKKDKHYFAIGLLKGDKTTPVLDEFGQPTILNIAKVDFESEIIVLMDDENFKLYEQDKRSLYTQYTILFEDYLRGKIEYQTTRKTKNIKYLPFAIVQKIDKKEKEKK